MHTSILSKYPTLKPFVKEVFTLQSHQEEGNLKPFKHYADGLPGIMFHETEGGLFYHDLDSADEGTELYPLFIYGQTLEPIELTVYGNFKLIIFYLQPHVLKEIFQIDADKIVDECIDMTTLALKGVKELLRQLQATHYIEEQTDLLAHFLAKLVPTETQTQPLDEIIQQIEFNNDSFNFSAISNGFPGSQRTFQRMFKKNVGLSPRLFARVAKFNNSLQKLESSDFQSLTELAHQSGYADQSHFIRTFKEFTGLTPKEFLASMDKVQCAKQMKGQK